MADDELDDEVNTTLEDSNKLTNSWKKRKSIDEKTVYRVVLTGGPCGGKTTALARLTQYFEGIGWKVLRVPEVATFLFNGGIAYEDLNEEQAITFQSNLSHTVLQMEKTFFDVADALSQDCLVLCDRGFMDAFSYLSEESSMKIFQMNTWKKVDFRDGRYNQVIHMVTAANGATEFYTTQNNSARKETVEQARDLDDRTLKSWVGHPYIDIVNNSTDFDGKINKVITAICGRLGISTSDQFLNHTRKKKFLVASMPGDEVFPDFQDFQVTVTHLNDIGNDVRQRLTKREQGGVAAYLLSTARQTASWNRPIVTQRIITEKEYRHYLFYSDGFRLPLRKQSRCFVYEGRYFTLDRFDDHPGASLPPGLCMLHVYATKETSELELPWFLDIEREVSGLPDYSLWYMSLPKRPRNPINLQVETPLGSPCVRADMLGAESAEESDVNVTSCQVILSEDGCVAKDAAEKKTANGREIPDH